ncbi:hypothetical protein L1887_16231 [Cichorium endivia]|nr:hypothetical protein L1887_16231 [Cichorium endivia]
MEWSGSGVDDGESDLDGEEHVELKERSRKAKSWWQSCRNRRGRDEGECVEFGGRRVSTFLLSNGIFKTTNGVQ